MTDVVRPSEKRYTCLQTVGPDLRGCGLVFGSWDELKEHEKTHAQLPSKTMVHRVCQFLSDEAEIATGEAHSCKKCELTIESPYGPGVQGCVMRAQELIALVRSSDETPEQLLWTLEWRASFDGPWTPYYALYLTRGKARAAMMNARGEASEWRTVPLKRAVDPEAPSEKALPIHRAGCASSNTPAFTAVQTPCDCGVGTCIHKDGCTRPTYKAGLCKPHYLECTR